MGRGENALGTGDAKPGLSGCGDGNSRAVESCFIFPFPTPPRWIILPPPTRNGGRSSVGRAPDCDSGCRGFESRRSPHLSQSDFPLKFGRVRRNRSHVTDAAARKQDSLQISQFALVGGSADAPQPRVRVAKEEFRQPADGVPRRRRSAIGGDGGTVQDVPGLSRRSAHQAACTRGVPPGTRPFCDGDSAG